MSIVKSLPMQGLFTVMCFCGGLVASTASANAASKIDVKGKVVLANAEKHTVSFRVAGKKKDIASKKATVISPKKFPISFDFWNGKRSDPKWVPQTINEAGIYVFRFHRGQWTLNKHQAKPKTATPPKASSGTTQRRVAQPTYRRPSYRAATGTAPRVVRRSGRVYRGVRFPSLYRIGGSILSLYRFIRNEEDRELLRDIIIGGEIDDAIEEDFWDRLDDMAVNLPAADRLELERAARDLENISDQDIDYLKGATDADWDMVRDELGDRITDDMWDDVEGDWGDLDGAVNLPADEIDGLGDVGIDTLDTDVDLGDLGGGEFDMSDIGMGDIGSTLDSVDFGGLGGGIEDIDIGNLDYDFGPGGIDAGGFGGGFGSGNAMPDMGGGFGYDAGGYDDFGGNMGGNFDFGGGYQTPEFGGFGGGYGGGFDGGFGGGFDGGFGGDFGGGGFGGFDDFGGGGFDDFGGGFDW